MAKTQLVEFVTDYSDQAAAVKEARQATGLREPLSVRLLRFLALCAVAVVIIAAMVIGGLIGSWISSHFLVPAIGAGLGYIAAFPLVLRSLAWADRRLVKRRLAAWRVTVMPVRLGYSETGIWAEDDVFTVTYAWAALQSVFCSDYGVVIVTDATHPWMCITRAAFADKVAMEAFADSLAAMVAEHRRAE